MHSYCMPPVHLSETYTTLTSPTCHACHKYQTYTIYSHSIFPFSGPLQKKPLFTIRRKAAFRILYIRCALLSFSISTENKVPHP